MSLFFFQPRTHGSFPRRFAWSLRARGCFVKSVRGLLAYSRPPSVRFAPDALSSSSSSGHPGFAFARRPPAPGVALRHGVRDGIPPRLRQRGADIPADRASRRS